MAIRFADGIGRLGGLRAALGAASTSILGTNTAPAARSGVLATQLDGAAGALLGLTAAAANRQGQITTLLAGARSGFSGGTSQPGAQPFDYYVSPTGSDANPGTLSAPWAITAINTKQATYAGKRVGLLPGTYPLQSLAATRGSGPSGYIKWVLDIDGGSSGNPTYVASCDVSGNYSRGAAILDQSSSAAFTIQVSAGSASATLSNISGTPLKGSVVTAPGIAVDTIFTAVSGASATLSKAPSAAVNASGTSVCYGNPNGNNQAGSLRAGNPSIGHSGTTPHVGNVTIDGIACTGNLSAGIAISNVALPTSNIPGITIQNCEVYGNNGVGSEDGDNLCAIVIANCLNALISNCYMHDNVGYATNSANHRTATLQWQSSATWEFCTCVNSGGIYGKEAQTGPCTVRFCYVDDSNDTTGDTAWAAFSDFVEGTSLAVYGNILIGQHPLSAIRNLGGGSTAPVDIHGNTVIIDHTHGGDFYGIGTSINSPGALTLYNNIVANSGGAMNEGYGLHTLATISLMDFNLYCKGSGSDKWTSWTNQGSGTGFSSLTAWQAATGKEAHSQANTASALFVGSGAQLAQKYQLQPGSSAKNFGRVAGSVSGIAIDAGAWGCINPDTAAAAAQIGCSFGP